MTANATQIHATCISIDGIGLILRGPSGSGKSDLALRLMERSAQLISDDRVDLICEDGVLIGRAPDRLSGLLEVRGVGIIEVPYGESARVWGLIDLVNRTEIERLRDTRIEMLCGIELPCFLIDPSAPSAEAKVRLVSGLVSGSIMRTDD